MTQPTDIKPLGQLLSQFPASSSQQAKNQANEGSVSTAQAPSNSTLASQSPLSAQVVTKASKNSPSSNNNESQLQNAVLQVNSYLQNQNRELQFSVDKSTGEIVVKVVDQSSGKVLRQIPPKYMVQLAQMLQKDSHLNTTGLQIKT